MFANEYQGGAHVEVLSTQGQNPLAQWKVTGPQKGVQKVYDKALKGYVFVNSGGCRLTLPKDERSALGLVQPHLLLQVEVGVGTPFSVEIGLSDASATRRRIILSASFSEVKSTPLHCQVPFSGLPRECWLNLVLPLAELAAAFFKVGGQNGGGAAAAGAASLSAGASLSTASSSSANMSYRTLDSLQLAGTCRLRRICTLKETPQAGDLADAGASGAGQPASAKPLEFPAGVDHQTLFLDPRSLSLVGISTSGGSPSQTTSLGTSGGSGSSGLGVVGTSTGSSRRGASGTSGGTTSPLPGVSQGGRSSSGVVGRGGAATTAPTGAGTPATPGDDDSSSGCAMGGGGGSASMAVASSVLHNAGDPPARGSSSGASTPTSRAGSAVPTLPPAFGATGHHGLTAAEHGTTPSRLGRSPSGVFSAGNGAGNSQSQTGASSGQNSGPASSAGSGPLPPVEPGSSGAPSFSSGGLKLPPVQCSHGCAAASSSGGTGGGSHGASASSPGGDDGGRGDGSPFGSRRALSAQTPPRPGGAPTPPGSAGGQNGGNSGAAAGSSGTAGGGGASSGKPPAPPWPGSASSKRAQSGPARISTEALAQGLGDTVAPADTPTSPSLAPRQVRRTQNNSHIPPTISEHEATPPTATAGGTPVAKSPARSPSRVRAQQSTSVISTVTVVPTPSTGAAAGAPTAASSVTGTSRTSFSCAPAEPASPALPHLRHMRAEAPAGGNGREQPASPAASSVAASGANPFAMLSSVLTIRGGMEASIDFSSHGHLPEGSPGSSSILSTNLRISSVTGHAHRYGGGGGAAAGNGAAGSAPNGTSAEASSESEDGALSPSGGTAAATATVTVVAAAAADAMAVKVPRIRTRVLPGGGAAGGGGAAAAAGAGAVTGKAPSAAADGSNGRTAPSQGVVPSSPSLNTRKGAAAAGHGSDVDTPTRAGRGGLTSAVSQNGRNSPANTPSRAGGGRMTPLPGGGASGAGPVPSSLNPNAKQRKEDGTTSGRPSATSATLAAPAAAAASERGTGGTVGGAGAGAAARDGRGPAAAGGGGGSTASKPSASASPAVCSSPARQRPAAPSSASRGPSRPTAAAAAGPSVAPGEPRDRDRLPPLVTAGGRGRGAAGRGAAAAAGAVTAGGGTGVGGAGGRGKPAAKPRAPRDKRPTTSNEVDVEESITLNAGMWGGFGVDEDDDILGSRHFRSGGLGGSSGSDADGDGGMLPSTPSLRRGLGGGGGGNGSFVRRASGSSSPDAPRGGTAEELPSPPNHYTNANANGLLSPPIRRTSGAVAAAQDVIPGFAGFFAPGTKGGVDRRRSSGTGAAAPAEHGPAAAAPRNVLDSILDEEALLAGHTRDLDQYDDWARVDQRPTPPDLLHPHRAFTPPVVPASKSLGVAIDAGRGSGSGRGGSGGDTAAGGGRGGAGGRGGGSGPGDGTNNRQVLRLSGAAAAAAGRGQGVVIGGGGEAMLDLVYDPVLNCYYDGSTGQYYELKT